MVQLNIRLDEELKAKADKRAHEEQMDTSAYIRRLIAEDGKTRDTTADKIKKAVEKLSQDKQEAFLLLIKSLV